MKSMHFIEFDASIDGSRKMLIRPDRIVGVRERSPKTTEVWVENVGGPMVIQESYDDFKRMLFTFLGETDSAAR